MRRRPRRELDGVDHFLTGLAVTYLILAVLVLILRATRSPG